MRGLLAIMLAGCGAAPPAIEWADEAPFEDLRPANPEDRPPAKAAPPPKGPGPTVRPPLPDGWPRDPVEPLPLGARARTLMDHADPVARFVTDLPNPGALTITLKARKASSFKADVVLHDAFGATFFEGTLTDSTTIGPRAMLPGTIYLLVSLRGGVAELQVEPMFEGEAPPAR